MIASFLWYIFDMSDAPDISAESKVPKKNIRPTRKVGVRRVKKTAVPEHIIGKKIEFERHPGNPILTPLQDSMWESWQTFNPAAIEIDGTVYLFYRAIGDDGMSRV